MQHCVAILRDSAEELASLYEEHGHGLTDAEMSRKKEPLERLTAAPEAFQFRNREDRSGEKERHVRRLTKALERQDGFFDPLLLFAIDGHRIVLDGHCRLRAYLRADLEPSTEVPVLYFRETFSEALTRPALENSKAKLGLTQEERLESAWKLVLFDEERGNYSLRNVAEATGVGKSTVGNMRKILESADGLERDPRDLTWKEVKRGRRENRDHDPDWRDKIVNRWRSDIRRALGDDPNQMPDLLFTALREGYPQIFPQMIPRKWAEEAGIVDELRVEAVEDFEF